MNDGFAVEIVSIDRIDDMLGGFAWAQVSVGIGTPEEGPCPEVVLRVPIQYESGMRRSRTCERGSGVKV